MGERNFSWALFSMKEGRSVRRRGWEDKKLYIFNSIDGPEIMGWKTTPSSVFLCPEDVLAKDWEIIGNESSQ